MFSTLGLLDGIDYFNQSFIIPTQTGPGRRTVASIHRSINLGRPGSYVREANARNGVGRPPCNKETI